MMGQDKPEEGLGQSRQGGEDEMDEGAGTVQKRGQGQTKTGKRYGQGNAEIGFGWSNIAMDTGKG